MPLIARGRTADIVTTNELCQPQTTTDGHSETVFVANVGVHRLGDANTIHLWLHPTPTTPCVPHSTNMAQGSRTVFADNINVAREGDRYAGFEQLTTVTQSTVFANGD